MITNLIFTLSVPCEMVVYEIVSRSTVFEIFEVTLTSIFCFLLLQFEVGRLVISTPTCLCIQLLPCDCLSCRLCSQTFHYMYLKCCLISINSKNLILLNVKYLHSVIKKMFALLHLWSQVKRWWINTETAGPFLPGFVLHLSQTGRIS